MRKWAPVVIGVLAVLGALIIFSGVTSYSDNVINHLPPLFGSTSKETLCQRPECYRYHAAEKRFNVSPSLLTSMGLPPKKYADLSMDTLKQFVVVTGASSDHFPESIDAVASVQTNLPTRKLIYYDLGLRPGQIAQLKTWCNVEYRKYNTTRYPPVARNLQNYAWKPIIIQDVLREYPAAFWMDSSIRWMTPDMTQLYERARDSGGFVLSVPTEHSNFAVTHPGMFRYLATNTEKQKRTEQFGATAIFIVNTRSNFHEVLWWYYLCALTEDCVAPSKQRYCRFATDRFGEFAGCHRFDQSLANVLLSTRWDYDPSRYAMGASNLYLIERFVTSHFRVKTC